MENKTKYVLVVEDNPSDFDEFEQLLLQLGFTAIRQSNKMPVASYRDAIDILRTGLRIEFALLDINLPGEKTGVDIAQYILQNRYPIKIVFTTAYLTGTVAEEIAYVGSQFGTIAKPDGIVDSKISLFSLRQLLAPSNPLQAKVIDNIFVVGKIVDPTKQIKEHIKDDRLKFSTRVIEKKAIYYILSGNSEIINVPKNYSLIITDSLKIGILIHSSLDKFMEESLDKSFVRINECTCINLQHYEGIIERKAKLKINVQDHLFEVSKKYRHQFEQRLKSYKLVP